MPMLPICAPMESVISVIAVSAGEQVKHGQLLLILEAMKMQTSVVAPCDGQIGNITIEPGHSVKSQQVLLELSTASHSSPLHAAVEQTLADDNLLLNQFKARQSKTLDAAREQAMSKRHGRGYRSARENLAQLCDADSFIEYGQLAVAAQRLRKDYAQLQSTTAADGIITGTASINGTLGLQQNCSVAVVINDYTVLAGTQGYYHHLKLDRILAVAEKQKLPVIMYTEGGGGRPGDTDINTVYSGLQCQSFTRWARLSGVVPRIAVANGFCFAGNAALFGAADITIATESSWIGMAGPAMIEGGGLGVFAATDIGPIDVQAKNGVVDLVAKDEKQATEYAKLCLSYFQGRQNQWGCAEQSLLRQVLPADRRYVYDVRKVITLLADSDSFTELKVGFGGAIITGFIRIQGQPIGLLASDCKVLGGAIDVAAGEKAADFIRLCEQFKLPILSLCDTPGFMVGPKHEELGAVRRLARMFVAGAQLSVPLVAIVLRKCYGLGAQALLGGSTSNPIYTVAWPNGEFGGMGLEGAVKLGFKQELAAQTDPQARQQLFDSLLTRQYESGRASEVASILEIDGVIDPADSRKIIIQALQAVQNCSQTD
jgi:acetyl-CoA carboxylase carboxyltransferase component